jgi:hypothetical protein
MRAITFLEESMPVRRVVARLRECKKETVPMLQRVAAIVAAVVIAAPFPGLLAAQAENDPAQTSNEATVCIFQPAGSGFGTAGVYLDGDYIGTLHGGRYFCFALAPGQHSFVGATDRSKFWKGSLTATLAAGRLYYLESSTAYKRFKPIPNRQAFKEQTADSKDLGSSAKVRWVSLPLPAASVNRQAASPAPVISPPSLAATSVDAKHLEAKYPDADLAVKEVSPEIYELTVLKENVQIGRINVGQGGPALTIEPSYLGKNLVFIGNITNFVGAASPDMRSRTINAASLSYDPSVQVNPPLADLGVVALNDSGIVKSDTAKSGWINWTCTVKFDDSGRTRTARIENISFWVNRGGENWLSFLIGKAHEVRTDGTLGAEVPVTAKLEQDGANGSVTILVEDKYLFRPSIKDSQTLEAVAQTNQTATTSQPQTQRANELLTPYTIPFDPIKVSLDRVIAVITNVFNTHGYKTTSGGATFSRIQDGKITATFKDTTDPTVFISTDKQPPIAGVNSTEWFYRADVKSRSVELLVWYKLPKPDPIFGGYGTPPAWKPPDLKVIQNEIQNQLSR